MKKLTLIILTLLLILTIPQKGNAQLPSDYEDWWFWPENAGDCRIYVKEYPGQQPVYFISNLGMDFTYIEKFMKLDSAEFHAVFFDQPGVTHSICYDTNAIRPKAIFGYLDTIRQEIHKGDSMDIVCHGNGCLLALQYLKNHKDVESVHMIQPELVKKDGKLLLKKKDQRLPYMNDLNKAYGAGFFSDARKWILQSLPDRQKIPKTEIFYYLTESGAKIIKDKFSASVYRLKSSEKGLDFLKNENFWQALQSNLLKSE